MEFWGSHILGFTHGPMGLPIEVESGQRSPSRDWARGGLAMDAAELRIRARRIQPWIHPAPCRSSISKPRCRGKLRSYLVTCNFKPTLQWEMLINSKLMCQLFKNWIKEIAQNSSRGEKKMGSDSPLKEHVKTWEIMENHEKLWKHMLYRSLPVKHVYLHSFFFMFIRHAFLEAAVGKGTMEINGNQWKSGDQKVPRFLQLQVYWERGLADCEWCRSLRMMSKGQWRAVHAAQGDVNMHLEREVGDKLVDVSAGSFWFLFMMHYPLVNSHIAIEHGHRNSGFSHKEMVIFHCYVSSPEGIL